MARGAAVPVQNPGAFLLVHEIRSLVAGVWMAGTVLGLTPTSALAAPIITPTGLNPGDHYRLAFVGTGSALPFRN